MMMMLMLMLMLVLVLYQAEASAAAAADDSDDPEIQFLKSLTPKQKKRLLKYVLSDSSLASSQRCCE